MSKDSIIIFIVHVEQYLLPDEKDFRKHVYNVDFHLPIRFGEEKKRQNLQLTPL